MLTTSCCVPYEDSLYDKQKIFEENFKGTPIGVWAFDMTNVKCAFLTTDDTTVNAEIKDNFLSYESVIVDSDCCMLFMEEYTKYLISLSKPPVYKSEGWVYYWDGTSFRIRHSF